MAELFNIELKFACNLLKKWYKFKIKSNYLNVPNILRIEYERNHPITADSKCKICNFPLDVSPKGLEYKENEQSYLDFLIRKEHTFIRNIFDKEELQKSRYFKSLEDYHDAMCLYIHLVRIAECEIKNVESYDLIYDNDLQEFLKDQCPADEYNLPGLINEIKSVEVRNFKIKLPKFTIQLYAFFYQSLIDFPPCKFDELRVINSNQ